MRQKLTLLIFILSFFVNTLKAQNWGGGIDEDRFNFGFGFQYISSEFKFNKSKNWRDPHYDAGLGTYVTDSLSAIESPPSVGFGIGFVVNVKANPNVDIRFTPTLVFNDRLMNYYYVVPGTYNPTQPVINKKVQATVVDLPIGIKLKSDRLMNFRAYMIGGIKYSIDLASDKKNNDSDAAPINKLIKNKKSFLSYEAGLGVDLYFEYFKMSPEVKMSYSFKDIFLHENQPYSNPIDQAKLRHFTFSLFFE